jgi:hypothetical protein
MAGDRRIRVLIAEGKGVSATTFSEAEIERIVEIAGPRHHPWQQGRGEDKAIQERRRVSGPIYTKLDSNCYEPLSLGSRTKCCQNQVCQSAIFEMDDRLKGLQPDHDSL